MPLRQLGDQQHEAEHDQHDHRQRPGGAAREADALTSCASATIAIVNVSARPSTIPSGRRRPPTALADSSAGTTGSTHGVIAVPAPAIKREQHQQQHLRPR